MEQELSVHFDRLEASFNALIESIRSYNPSVTAADDLLEADKQLAGGLERLARHQSNYRSIVQLRRTAESLDAQIKSVVSRLADLRKDIQDSSWTEPSSANSSRVHIKGLLEYADTIARSSVPPNYRHRPVIPPKAEREESMGKQEVQDTQDTVDDMEQMHSQHVKTNLMADAASFGEARDGDERGQAWEKMADWQKALLDEARNAPYVPWPNETVLRMGALANIQAMSERGEEPWANLGSAELGSAANGEVVGSNGGTIVEGNKSVEDKEGQSRGFTSQAQPQKSQMAGFGLYNPDEDDE